MFDLIGGTFHPLLKLASCLLFILFWLWFVVVAQGKGRARLQGAPENPKRAIILGAVFIINFGCAIALMALIHWVYGSNWPVLVGAPLGLIVGFKEVRRLMPRLES